MDVGRHSQIIPYLWVCLSISPPVSPPDCLRVNTSECWSAFLAVHLHPRLAACQPDHLPASLSSWWLACLADRMPGFMSVCLCAAAPTCLCACQCDCLSDRVPQCSHEDVPWAQLSYITHSNTDWFIHSYRGIFLGEENRLTWMENCLYCMLKNGGKKVNWEFLIRCLVECKKNSNKHIQSLEKKNTTRHSLVAQHLTVYLISCSRSLHSPLSKDHKMTVRFFFLNS